MFTIAWESVEKTDLLVLYQVLTPSVYTGGGDPHSQASQVYFCIAGQTNPLESQEQGLGQFTWKSAVRSIYLRNCSKKSFFSSQTLIRPINFNTPHVWTGLICWLILRVLNVLNIPEVMCHAQVLPKLFSLICVGKNARSHAASLPPSGRYTILHYIAV